MGLNQVGIDQSGKINKTEHDTALVFCPLDSTRPFHAVYVPKKVTARVHSNLKNKFKSRSSAKWFGPKMYAVGLYFLLRDPFHDIREIQMEDEYPGNKHKIFDTLKNWFNEENKDFNRDKFVIPPQQVDFRAHDQSRIVRNNPSKATMKLEYYHFKEKML